MKRRDYVLGGAALGAVLGGVGIGTGATSLLTGEPTDSTGISLSPGVFEFLTHGVDTVAWRAVDDDKAQLAVTYTDIPPDSLRLHNAESKKIWAVEAPEGAEDTYTRGLPLNHLGTWELVVEQAGNYSSLQLPVQPAFEAQQVGLSGDRLHITVGNPSDAPAWLQDIQVTVKDRYTERWRLLDRIMPGDTVLFTAEWPFNHYEDVTVYATSGGENRGQIAETDFV